MSDDVGFAPPPFQPEEALQRLRRELRELGLSEREGVFERRGLAIARARVDGAGRAAQPHEPALAAAHTARRRHRAGLRGRGEARAAAVGGPR
jgi:hypothetical protein